MTAWVTCTSTHVFMDVDIRWVLAHACSVIRCGVVGVQLGSASSLLALSDWRM